MKEIQLPRKAALHPQVFLERQKPWPLFKGGDHDWEQSILNPTVWQEDNERIYLFYRGVNAGPRGYFEGKYQSSVGFGVSRNGIDFIRDPKPLLVATESYEDELGIEDPTVIKFEGTYFLYYVAVSRSEQNERLIRIALATSRNLRDWKKYGIVGPNVRSKSAILFPERVDGQVVMLYTVWTEMPESAILIARFDSVDDLIHPPDGFMDAHLGNYQQNLFLGPSLNEIHKGPEIGAVPIKLRDGRWLLVICPENPHPYDEWGIAALLLEKDLTIQATVNLPLKGDLTTAERGIICDRCAFPRGALIMNRDGVEMLYIYIGTADDGAALAYCRMDELMAAFERDRM
jgi:predicted GH43/DUF377 family glycosyl hydrolase